MKSQTKVQLNPGSSPAALLVGGKQGGLSLRVGSPYMPACQKHERMPGKHHAVFTSFDFSSLSTSHCQVVHLWCDPLHAFLCTPDLMSILPLVLCSPMKTDYHSL